jgi:eukaryotic-like serine/threonine-protein kinase
MGEAAPELTGIELVLNRYRPLRPLGSGGSGSVWLARDERTGLDVALKIVAREGKSAMRAEREAKAAAHLRHPACLRAYGFGRDSRHVYIAYEFVPGQTYREALRAGELTDDEAVEACAQVCDGLAHAHAAGILHRDVKPSNVLLAHPDAAGGRGTSGRASPASPAKLAASRDRVSARVLDFGLAQMADAETLTEAGDVPGTLAYISPERLAGGEATPAADVWAVGVMLWEALAGRHPFWRGSMLETARAIEAGARPLSALRPDLPKRLLRLVDSALSPNPARRPTARDLADALRGAASSAAVPRPGFRLPTRIEGGQALTAVLAALLAGWTSSALPFYPHGWPVLLSLLALAATLLRERIGIALALAVPVLPLGNISLGLALFYTAFATGWLLVTWREPRATLLFVVGPLLAPIAALGLLPLAAARTRSAPLRALTVAIGVLTAALAAGIRHAALPLVGGPAPLGVGVTGARDPFDVAGSLARAAGAHPSLLIETCALALVALALPHARARGRWAAAGLGAGMIVLTVAAVPSAAALPLLLAAWAIAAVTALRAPALGVPSAAA